MIQTMNADLEKRVIQRTAELEAANASLEAFSYSVSHDLRVPLRGIDQYSLTVLEANRDVLPQEGLRQLTTIRECTQRMARLIDDLLNFSMSSRLPLKMEPLVMENIVNSVVAQARELEPQRQVEIQVSDLHSCEGDSGLLRSVWTNLISNALKFTSTRKVSIIKIGSENQADERVFFIRDNGIGFDMEYAKTIFKVFERLHPSEEFEGSGIGLANVQRIIKRHGGRVWAVSSPEEGATFYFTVGGADRNDGGL